MAEFSRKVHVHIDGCQGDLALRGRDQPELEIRSLEDLAEDVIEQAEDTFHLPELPQCRLFVPRQATVVVGHVVGDLKADGLIGDLEVNKVDSGVRVEGGTLPGDFGSDELTGNVKLDSALGDVSLREVAGDAVVRLTGGDLRARQIGGALQAEEVHGDVRVRNLTGVLELGHVAGDAILVNLRGGAEVRQVDGDVVLKTELVPGARYSVRARGNVVLRIPLETGAHLVLEAPAGEIHSTISLEVKEKAAGRLVGTLGRADKRAEVLLHTTGGNITLRPLTTSEDRTTDQINLGFDPEAIAEMVRAHVVASLGTSNVDEFVHRETERALRRAERARAKAERAAERAQAKAERAAERARARVELAEERAQRHMERQMEKAGKRGRGARRKKWAFHQTSEPVTEEERAAVLKMLQEGKITAEEANQLLEALEG
jgi:DUF4097 and DUF4098 domain-containing protein YvlB